ncbi:MAG: hypothetical protein LBI47_00045 [Puniceicoccales bacterium]|jgi:hypothetical protein|nr:hypothetical protein [Puniceicoccales bacterium]
MDVNTEINVMPSAIPNDNHVSMLRNSGYEVHVFQRLEGGRQDMIKRRMVAIKLPYAENGKYEYDTYDSALEDEGLFPMKTLTEREVKDLQNDQTFTHEGP